MGVMERSDANTNASSISTELASVKMNNGHNEGDSGKKEAATGLSVDTTAEPKKQGRKRKGDEGSITSTATGGPPPAKKPRAKKVEPPGPSRVSERYVCSFESFLHYIGLYTFLGFTRTLIGIPLSMFALASSSESRQMIFQCLSVSIFVDCLN
jgi:hypothetical protein